MYINTQQLAERWGVDRVTVWRWSKEPSFPKAIKLSPACVRYKLADIEDYEAAKKDGDAAA